MSSFDVGLNGKICEICKNVASGAIPDDSVKGGLRYACPNHQGTIYKMIEESKKK
jgi:hypothetical protein